jgi:hypothetical protein
MTLGDRCDEIVRLIDETLLSVATYITADTDDHTDARSIEDGATGDGWNEGVPLIDHPRAGDILADGVRAGDIRAEGVRAGKRVHPTATGRTAHPSGSALVGLKTRRLAVVAGGSRRGPSHTVTGA